MEEKQLIKIINCILRKRDAMQIDKMSPNMSLRKDLNFDSFDLAELTVIIEDEFGVDIFEDGIIDTVGEIMDKIQRGNE